MIEISTALKAGISISVICYVTFKIPANKTKFLEQQFQDYMTRFSKVYETKEEYHLRFKAFQESLEAIARMNSNRTSSSALYGLTKFSDMTEDEFLYSHLQMNLTSKVSDNKNVKREISNLPNKIDWRDSGVVTKVKNQKGCGACWAFCVVENAESMNAMKNKRLETLSVQEMIDCAGYNNDGCLGGDMCLLMQWIKDRNVPLIKEVEYPLSLKNEACKLKKNDTGVKIDKFECSNVVDNEKYILKALSSVGPVAVAINALSWQNYLEGVIQYHCDGSVNLLNHAVQIVGYDLTPPVPHYIVRNSWGPDFGDKGYLYIAIGSNLCGLANEVTFLTVL